MSCCRGTTASASPLLRRSTRSRPCLASQATRQAASACSRRRSSKGSAAMRTCARFAPALPRRLLRRSVHRRDGDAGRPRSGAPLAFAARSDVGPIGRLAGSSDEPARRAKTRRPRRIAVRGAAGRRNAGARCHCEFGRARRGGQPAGAHPVAGSQARRSVRARPTRARRHRRAPPGDGERRSRDGAVERARAGRTAVRRLLSRRSRQPRATVVATLITLRDQTEARRVERLRVDFIANASHELRTPLASLVGFIETLQGSAHDDAEGARPVPHHHARAGSTHGQADRRPAVAFAHRAEAAPEARKRRRPGADDPRRRRCADPDGQRSRRSRSVSAPSSRCWWRATATSSCAWPRT